MEGRRIYLSTAVLIVVAVLFSFGIAHARPCSGEQIIGDVNNDREINYEDMSLLNDILLSNTTPTIDKYGCADVNLDGVIDNNDIFIIRQYAIIKKTGLYAGIKAKCAKDKNLLRQMDNILLKPHRYLDLYVPLGNYLIENSDRIEFLVELPIASVRGGVFDKEFIKEDFGEKYALFYLSFEWINNTHINVKLLTSDEVMVANYVLTLENNKYYDLGTLVPYIYVRQFNPSSKTLSILILPKTYHNFYLSDGRLYDTTFPRKIGEYRDFPIYAGEVSVYDLYKGDPLYIGIGFPKDCVGIKGYEPIYDVRYAWEFTGYVAFINMSYFSDLRDIMGTESNKISLKNHTYLRLVKPVNVSSVSASVFSPASFTYLLFPTSFRGDESLFSITITSKSEVTSMSYILRIVDNSKKRPVIIQSGNLYGPYNKGDYYEYEIPIYSLHGLLINLSQPLTIEIYLIPHTPQEVYIDPKNISFVVMRAEKEDAIVGIKKGDFYLISHSVCEGRENSVDKSALYSPYVINVYYKDVISNNKIFVKYLKNTCSFDSMTFNYCRADLFYPNNYEKRGNVVKISYPLSVYLRGDTIKNSCKNGFLLNENLYYINQPFNGFIEWNIIRMKDRTIVRVEDFYPLFYESSQTNALDKYIYKSRDFQDRVLRLSRYNNSKSLFYLLNQEILDEFFIRNKERFLGVVKYNDAHFLLFNLYSRYEDVPFVIYADDKGGIVFWYDGKETALKWIEFSNSFETTEDAFKSFVAKIYPYLYKKGNKEQTEKLLSLICEYQHGSNVSVKSCVEEYFDNAIMWEYEGVKDEEIKKEMFENETYDLPMNNTIPEWKKLAILSKLESLSVKLEYIKRSIDELKETYYEVGDKDKYVFFDLIGKRFGGVIKDISSLENKISQDNISRKEIKYELKDILNEIKTIIYNLKQALYNNNYEFEESGSSELYDIEILWIYKDKGDTYIVIQNNDKTSIPIKYFKEAQLYVDGTKTPFYVEYTGKELPPGKTLKLRVNKPLWYEKGRYVIEVKNGITLYEKFICDIEDIYQFRC